MPTLRRNYKELWSDLLPHFCKQHSNLLRVQTSNKGSCKLFKCQQLFCTPKICLRQALRRFPIGPQFPTASTSAWGSQDPPSGSHPTFTRPTPPSTRARSSIELRVGWWVHSVRPLAPPAWWTFRHGTKVAFALLILQSRIQTSTLPKCFFYMGLSRPLLDYFFPFSGILLDYNW